MYRSYMFTKELSTIVNITKSVYVNPLPKRVFWKCWFLMAPDQNLNCIINNILKKHSATPHPSLQRKLYGRENYYNSGQPP